MGSKKELNEALKSLPKISGVNRDCLAVQLVT